jgi:N-acetylneuraminate synthase
MVRKERTPVGIFQCTSVYPCPPEKLGLNVISEIRRRYDCPVGLSDHSGTLYSGLAAAALGAEMIEVHVTLSRECFGPDVAASITTQELKQLVEGVRFIETAQKHPVNKSEMAGNLNDLRMIFGKSVVAARDMTQGTVLTESDVALKKPGTGIPGSRLDEVLRRRLRRAVAMDSLLSEEDFEPREA